MVYFAVFFISWNWLPVFTSEQQLFNLISDEHFLQNLNMQWKF